MGGPLITLDELKDALDHLDLKPGEECPGCHRKIPEVKSDEQTGATRRTLSVSIPQGEPDLESLMIMVVDKFKDQWPRNYAAMRDGVGLETVGGRSWKYYVLHFALYALIMVPGLEPTEEG